MLPLLTDWQHKGLDIIISTSGESLENLLSMVGNSGREWLLNQQLLVISERVATLAKQLGFKRSALVAKSASDDEIVAMICKT